jgi:hypothetical protein
MEDSSDPSSPLLKGSERLDLASLPNGLTALQNFRTTVSKIQTESRFFEYVQRFPVEQL